MDGSESLEQIIRSETIEQSLPVITIGNKERLDEQQYRERCLVRLLDILLEIENYRGSGDYSSPDDRLIPSRRIQNDNHVIHNRI